MEDNNIEPILENLLLSQREGDEKTADLLENNIQATLKVAEAVEENAKKVPTIKVQIDGAEATTFQGPKGERGEDGKTPVKGVDYFTNEDIAEIATATARIIPKPKDGKDGVDGKDAPEVRPEQVASILRNDPTFLKAVEGKKGKDASPVAVARLLLQNEAFVLSLKGERGEDGKDGKDGTELTAKEIKDKLLEVGISYNEIKDAPTVFKQSSKTVSLSELDDVDLSGVTQTNGKYVLGSGGGGGAVDSVNGQTGVVVLDTDDIADTATNRYTNDTDIARLANTSGTNTGDQDLSGYELLSNKENTTINTSTTKYPTVNLLKTGLDTKAPTASPTFTGTVTLPTGLTGVLRADSGVVSTDSNVTDLVDNASTTVAGKIEIAIDAEVTTGTDATRAVSPDALAGSTIFGRKSLSVYVVGATTDVSAGDGQYYFMLPEALNGMNLVRAIARVVTAGTTNATTIDIFNVTDSVDMLSSAISIASGGTLATAGTVNTLTDDVATNDLIRIDVTSVSTTKPKGLIVEMEFQLP